jgi:hypothetical protein
VAKACFKMIKTACFLRSFLGEQPKINANKNLNRDTQVTLSSGFARFLDAFFALARGT